MLFSQLRYAWPFQFALLLGLLAPSEVFAESRGEFDTSDTHQIPPQVLLENVGMVSGVTLGIAATAQANEKMIDVRYSEGQKKSYSAALQRLESERANLLQQMDKEVNGRKSVAEGDALVQELRLRKKMAELQNSFGEYEKLLAVKNPIDLALPEEKAFLNSPELKKEGEAGHRLVLRQLRHMGTAEEMRDWILHEAPNLYPTPEKQNALLDDLKKIYSAQEAAGVKGRNAHTMMLEMQKQLEEIRKVEAELKRLNSQAFEATATTQAELQKVEKLQQEFLEKRDGLSRKIDAMSARVRQLRQVGIGSLLGGALSGALFARELINEMNGFNSPDPLRSVAAGRNHKPKRAEGPAEGHSATIPAAAPTAAPAE